MTGTWRRRLRDSGLCLVILLLLPVLFHVIPWLGDEVPADANHLQRLPPWEGLDSDERSTASPLAVWQLHSAWPAYRFLNAFGDDLPSLQWNPQNGLGSPFLANPNNRCFSPFSIPFYLFEFSLALLLSLVAKAVLAGWIAYYVAQRYGFTPWYALIVALIYQWSGPLLPWSMEPLGDGFVWLPLLLLATDRLILGHFRAWPGISIVVALMALSGDLALLTSTLVVMAIYMVFRRLRDHKRAHIRSALPGYAWGVVVGLGLASVQLLPFVTLLREGNIVDHGYPWSFDSGLLLGLFGPGYYRSITGGNNPLVHVVFVGVVPLLLISVWWALRRFVDRPIRHRVESLLFSTLLLASVPVLAQGLLPALGGLRFLHPVHYLAGLSFPLALMVAGSVETWLHLDAEQCKRALVRMAVYLPLWWGGLLIAQVNFARDESGNLAIYWPSLVVFSGIAFALILLFGGTLLYPQPRVLIGGIIALILLTVGWGEYPRSPSAHVFPQTEVIRALQRADSRVGGTARMSAWPLAGNEVPTLYGPSTAVLNRTQEFIAHVDRNPLNQRRAAIGALLLQKEDIQGAYAPVRADLNIVDVFDSGLVLFRDYGAYPRYRMAHRVESSADAPEELGPDSLPVIPGVLLPPVSGPVEDSIRVTDVPRNNSLELSVKTSHPGVLIVAEAWYPGWRAWVDGAPVPILPVDGTFRGVELRAGAHEVSFKYQSSALRWGAIASLFFLAVFLAGAFYASRRPKRRF
jgi:hypothetical protein